MDDDLDNFGVDTYIEDEAPDGDAELHRRRSSRAALATAADDFLRRHSGSGSSASPRPGAASRRRDADSVRLDKERLQRFASEAATFLDAAYENDADLIVEDVDAEGRPPGRRDSEDFRAKRDVELDKARLERFSKEAEAFIDAAYGEDEADFIEEEALSPRTSAAAADAERGRAVVDGGEQKKERNKAMMTQFHTQVMSVFAAREKKEKEAAEKAVDSEQRVMRRVSTRKIARDKEQLEDHYRETMAFLERAEEGEGLVQERELETGALERVRLKLYAEEAMNFLENAFKPDSDILIDDDSARVQADGGVSTDEETAQIRADRAAMEEYFDADDFGEDGVVEETLSDTSGGTDRGLFARRVGEEGGPPTDSSDGGGGRGGGYDDDWGGEDVDTDEEFDSHPALAGNVDATMAERVAVLDRELLVGDEGADSSSDDADGYVPMTAGKSSPPLPLRPGVVAADLPPELPDFPLDSPHGATESATRTQPSPSSHVTSESTPSSTDVVARSSSVAFAENNAAESRGIEGYEDGDRGFDAGLDGPGVAARPEEDCLMELLLEGTGGGGANSEWSEVPLEKSFYRAVPRGATIKLRSRASQRVLDVPMTAATDSLHVSAGARESAGSVSASAELVRVQQERDVVMAALEEIVNERSRMAAQISEMKSTIASTFGRARPAASEGGNIDIGSELKDAYTEFQEVIRESEATVNVLEGHIATSQKRVLELEGEVEMAHAQNKKLQRDAEGRESRDIAVRATNSAEADTLRQQLATVKEEQRAAVVQAQNEARRELEAVERSKSDAVKEADDLRRELKRAQDAKSREADALSLVQEELNAAKAENVRLEKEVAEAAASKAVPAASEETSVGTGNTHLWNQLATAREEAEEAQKGQDRAEKKLREMQASQSSMSSSRSISDGVTKADVEQERLRGEEAVLEVKREKDAEISSLRRALEEAEDMKRMAELSAKSAKRTLDSAGKDSSKADLAMTTRTLEDTRRRLDVLEIEHRSALAARKAAEAEAESLRLTAVSARNSGASELTALQAEVHGLREELMVKERADALRSQDVVSDAVARAEAAEEEATKARTALIESQQEAEREKEKHRRARKAAEAQRDALQAELGVRKEKEKAERKPGALVSSSSNQSGDDGGAKSETSLAKSSSKRGIGASLRKSSSKVGIGKKKDKDKDKAAGRNPSNLAGATASSVSEESSESKKKGRMRMW